jgi:hypothetical protein
MINHFATLLLNLNTFETSPSVSNYFLGNELEEILTTEDNELLILEDLKTYINITKMYNVLINKDYVKLNLPKELNDFYDIIFPPASSKYFKQFLLYCYLRLISSTDKNEDIKKFDSRISYNLDEIESYFRLNKLSSPLTNNTNFKVIPAGKFLVTETIEAPVQNFLIRQKENTNYVYVFSMTDGKYYKYGKQASSVSTDMEIEIIPANSANNISKEIKIGETGVSFTLFSKQTLNSLTDSNNSLWLFSVESPLKFDFLNKFEELNRYSPIVTSMLNFHKDVCSETYELAWNKHFNTVYKFTNLLLAYVERVNLVWDAKLT